MPTPIHRTVRAAQSGEFPRTIGRVRSGWLILGEQQALRGYMLLLSDPVVPNLNGLGPEERRQFLWEMGVAGDALLEVTGARLVNYMILGNLDRALHAHIFPRYEEEPEEVRTVGPWAYEGRPKVPFEAERDRGLMEQLKAAVERRLEPGSAGS
jgi:diadenosine tetraphosphate (Ap4A) HIT family hydrolase